MFYFAKIMSVNEKILSVSQITGQIKNLLEGGFSGISIEGEISNFKAHSSGHRYFSLKDGTAQISCVMWRSRPLSFNPEDGMKVIARGNISVFAPRGNYQLDITSMAPKGVGDLFIAFEKLKAKLEESGYFDAENKKALPTLPMKIGIATSQTGAAVRDMFSTIERRFPPADILLRPTIVQGDSAGEDIANAIEELSRENVDLIIIGRGGGSIEDLWAFNTEILADAVFKSEIPIISAVGHETDFTISDFVADLRAATPTAAAELSTPMTGEYLSELITNYKNFYTNKVHSRLDSAWELLDRSVGETSLNFLKNKISNSSQLLDIRLDSIESSLKNRFKNESYSLNIISNKIISQNPRLPLKRGYALLYSKGKALGREDKISIADEIEILRERDTSIVKVKKILPKKIF
jgi:exodeoxyribonuclease VII large subunit